MAQRGGVRLRLLQSEESSSADLVVRMAQDIGATEIHLNRREEPGERRREAELQRLAGKLGIAVKLHSAFLFRDPERCRIFQAIQRGMHIFKAFWAGWHQGGEVRPSLPAPSRLQPLPGQRNDLPFAGDADADWPFAGPMPTSRVTGRPLREHSESLRKIWDISEEFQKLEGGLARYRGSITRDAGPKAKESKLSLPGIYLVGVWWRVDHSTEQAKKWLRMLRYWPDLPEVSMRLAFRDMTWLRDAADDTVEVGPGNLRHTVGQFLVETLGVDWRVGEEWFHITLVDSDLAINSMMWQHQGLTGVSQWLIGIDCPSAYRQGYGAPRHLE
ncbi:CRYD [Symbiodinium sp. CCMP2592]|nr:CRYD [Symbiodinium sp. CCMP2592]